MKKLLLLLSIFLIAIISVIFLTQIVNALPYIKFEEAAISDSSLVPMYGGIPRTVQQKEADNTFIEAEMKISPTSRIASDKLIVIGFNALDEKDFRTAMRRFNQAWLLDPTNSDVFWGFGEVYVDLGDMKKGREYYQQGLNQDPENFRIMDDFAKSYWQEYTQGKGKSSVPLEQAIVWFEKTVAANPQQNADVLYTLSVAYFYDKNCAKAKETEAKFSAAIMAGSPVNSSISQGMKRYQADLARQCP